MSDIQDLERNIQQAKEVMAQRDMMNKLSDNHEFRKLIIEGYCVHETARFVHLSTDPNLSDRDRADALGCAQAAGYLKRFINAIIGMGNHAEGDIFNMEQARDELMSMGRENYEDQE